MPTVYACDTCHQTSTNLDNWLLIQVGFSHMDPAAPPVPGGRVNDGFAPDLIFDKAECRNAWCEQAGITPPSAPAPAKAGGDSYA